MIIFFPQDYEARINLLRKRTNQAPETETSESITKNEAGEIVSSVGHVDLFADHEDKQNKIKPMDEEKRVEQEKYEKQIGYLTYLGQDTHESLGTQSWYNAPRQKQTQNESTESGEKVEIGLKTKHLNDPMFQFLKKPFTVDTKKISEKKELPNISPTANNLHGISIELDVSRKRKRSVSPETKHKKSKSRKKSKDKKEKKKKHKKEKRKRKHSPSGNSNKSHSDSESEQLKQHKMQNLQKLREERLQRERQEQNRTKDFLRNKFPALLPPEEVKKPDESINTEPRVPLMKQKYNSQFNPYLAKQNY